MHACISFVLYDNGPLNSFTGSGAILRRSVLPYGKSSVTKFEDDLWETSWNLMSLSVYFRTS